MCIDRPYSTAVVPMPYGEFRAMPPAIVTNTAGNAGPEFNNVDYLIVNGGKGVQSVEQFRDAINQLINETNVTWKTPNALDTIEQKLVSEGLSVKRGRTVNGVAQTVN